MSDSHTGRKSQVPTSSTDNDRIKKLREKLSVAQKNLKISHDLPKDEKKFSSIVESSKSVNKMARDFLSDVTNTGHTAPNLVDKETNKYRSYVFNTGLTLDDLATFKGNHSRDRVLEQILRKVESYKENPFDSKALMETLVDKLHRNQSLYYDYIEEENVSVLRYLIGTLYQEIEALTIPGDHVEDETFGRHSHRVSALAKSYSQPPIEKELNVKRYSSHREERDHDSEWKPLLKELKEYFNVITNGPLAGQLMNNHFDITRSLQEKLQQVEPLADQPQSTRPNSITELFRKNASASASESFSKDNNKKQDASYHHSKSMVDPGDDRNRKLDELHNHIKDLQKENEEIKRQITSRSKSPSMERQQSQDNLLVKEELKRAIQAKEEAENECENLRREIRQLENEIAELNENQMQMNKESLAQIDNELKRARAQIVTLLDQKASVEKQAFKLKVDNEDLLDQVQACGFKLNDMANHKEILKAHIMTHENTIREKTAEIQRLNFEKSELEGKYTSLKKYEKDVDQNAKQMNILEGNINIMREELSNARNALAEAEENISNLKKERDIMMAKCETLENFDPRNVDPSILEHIAVILFTRLTQTKELNADLKNKLQKIFGDKFVNLLASLKKKLRRAETMSREYKQKYQEKLNSSVDKDHEIETLSSLLLQIQETIPRVEPGPKMASLIVLKDELERKRGTFIENVKKSTKTRENDLQELSKIYEESEEIPHDTTFNDISSPDFEGNFPMDLGKLIEENTALRSKVQDQANEISNLNAQLKFSNSVQETRRKTASRFGSNTERLAKSGRDYSSNREVEYNEEEETTRAFQNVSKYDDLYLMLRAQASSLELLLSNQI